MQELERRRERFNKELVEKEAINHYMQESERRREIFNKELVEKDLKEDDIVL